MTYFESYRQVRDSLAEAGVPEPDIDARYLVELVGDFSEAQYLLRRDETIPEEQLARLNELTARRCAREPLQYIIGSQEFMGLPFICNGDCLIPRQDTEILVEHAMNAVKQPGHGADTRVLDLCTGSGCVIVSLAKLCGLHNTVGTDISEAALTVAKSNAALNGVDTRFFVSDLFDGVEGTFDVITANPPYIDTDLIHGLIPEIWEYEPMVALDGGSDGLVFYRRIAAEAARYLTDGGWLLFEIGDTQGRAVADIMCEAGFENVSVHRDLAGLERVVKGRKP